MEVLYLLIPLSVVIILVVIVIFWWALESGQFDNIDREGERIFRSD
jgi:cbb3-type cytochrome oxidase maturation protein